MHHCPDCDYTYDEANAPTAARVIEDGSAEVARILRGHPAHVLRTRPREGVWSPLEYGCHLRDVLLVQRERVLAARRTDRPVCEPMGRDERVAHDGYAEQEPEDVARQLVDAARMLRGVLDRLGPDWARALIYPFPQPHEESLRWVAVHTVHEVRHHLLDIRGQVG